jgi:hypothetical protein
VRVRPVSARPGQAHAALAWMPSAPPSWLIKGGDTDGTDEFIARQAWLYVAIVAGAYLVSRGLAKSGSRERYFAGGTNDERDTDRR